MAGALSGLGQGLQEFSRTFLAAKQNQLERARQEKMDAMQLADAEARRKTEGLNQQQIEAVLNDRPFADALKDAQAISEQDGPEAKFGNPAYVAARKKAGIPVQTRDPLLPSAQMDFSTGKFGPLSTDDSVDPTTHAVLPPEVLEARKTRLLNDRQQEMTTKAIESFMNGDAAGGPQLPEKGKATPADRFRFMTAFPKLASQADNIFGSANGTPVTPVNTVNDKGQAVVRGIGRDGTAAWELPAAPTGAEKTARDDAQTALATLKSAERFFNPNVATGPMKSRVNEFLANWGLKNDPSYAVFLGETATLKNDVIRAVTGAQMSTGEAQRILAQVPTENEPSPAMWQAKKAVTERNLQEVINRKSGGRPGSTFHLEMKGGQPQVVEDALGGPSLTPSHASSTGGTTWTRSQYNTFLQQNPDVKGAELQQTLKDNGITITP